MGYPTQTEGQQSLGYNNIDAQRMLLALQEQLRAQDKVPAVAIAAGANLGTSPPAPALSANASDLRGMVTIQTGTGVPAAGPVVTITFSSVFANAPGAVWLEPAEAVAAANAPQFYIDNTKVLAASFTIACAVAPAASGTWKLFYRVER